jgi:hypothetical protein
MAPILFNGQQYDSVEAMPPDVRMAYETVKKAFADKDQDGIPDVFQGAGNLQQMMSQASTSSAVSAQAYTSPEEMPAEVREAYDEAMSQAGRIAAAGRAAARGGSSSAGGLRTTDADPVIKAGPAGMGMLWLGIAVILGLFIVAIFFALANGEGLIALFFPRRAAPDWAPIVGYLVIFFPAMALMMWGMNWLIRMTTIGNPADERALMESGETAEAVVVRLSDTGTTINKNPLVKLLLEVRPRTRPAYRVETQLLLSRLSVSQVQPGAVLSVRINPDDPHKFMFADMS